MVIQKQVLMSVAGLTSVVQKGGGAGAAGCKGPTGRLLVKDERRHQELPSRS